MKLFRYLLVVIMVFILIFFPSCDDQKSAQTSEPETFRLITYNVWYGFTKVPERKQMWIQWMQDQDPDVVSLQELNEYTPERLREDARKWGHSYAELLKTEGFPTGITSRYPIEDVQKTLEGFHHGLLRAQIRGIYFYVIHLHPSNWETRNREIDLILHDINTLPDSSKIILAGDFNTFSPSDSIYYSHGHLEPFFQERDSLYQEQNLKEGKLDYQVIQTLLDAGFKDLEYELREKNYDFYGSFPTEIEKEGYHGDQRRLDYVFVNRALFDRVLSAEIVTSDTTLVLSDHLPVMVDFKMD